ncbi:MAG: pyruvate kinase [Candidatus Magasanikbacteria bacterium RIFCSPLOWO2_01_FULL_43_20b]|uniref:Pyruvate kinase n=1 Tax=Candidatus Magasanikbacteria bacterium RIFCSPLOWO2_12_FULL_43_12 TaxID=1798692 RepID=A0A1F6MRC4_9BACT|nr:MAG: pyruvate kinase [Candidatus Magasanikbacteria bacterium RIFCSPLOWO2_01_FULL_43_20b]OGH74070.1 MAG: pyruvate kinase [Candidatus Magasanikbacteria bacterium RIFCSPLOWO2_12_FULL_43_12]
MFKTKRTKIVCTLGPSSESVEILTKMIKAGMNVARLNFSHGTYDNHQMLIKNIRAVEQKIGEPVAVMQDLQGPKIRVGIMPADGLSLKAGEMVTFDTAAADHSRGVIPVDYSDLHLYLKKGERLLLDDGRIETKIVRVVNTQISAEVIVGGVLTSHKGINAPDSKLVVRALTDKDKEDVKFGVANGVDLVALSFVTKPEDILDLRYLIKEYEKELNLKPIQPIRIVAKIERYEAVQNIKLILEAADGIMIARGDLGIEIPAQEVPLVQKRLIDLALDAAKPVIVATQMLDSMQKNPRPTRAEVSDVANAVIDHTDAVMLSNETAAGQYPVETVETMSNIIVETEKSVYDNLPMRQPQGRKKKIDDIISQMSRALAEEVGAKLILAASISGETARLISRYRPELLIVVATATDRVKHQMNLSWGVVPFILEPCRTIEELVERSLAELKKHQMVKIGDRIIIVAGEPVGHAGHVNLLEVREVN